MSSDSRAFFMWIWMINKLPELGVAGAKSCARHGHRDVVMKLSVYQSRLLLIIVCSLLFLPTFSQSIPESIYGQKLPYTWRVNVFGGGYTECTVNVDGTMTSRMVMPCFSCGSTGYCGVCRGTGGQYWYGMGVMPCSACGGYGRCSSCGGNGYTVTNTYTTQTGLTIGYDQHGNYYYATPNDPKPNPSNRDCTYCNGTGGCPSRNSNVSLYCGDSGRCRPCNGRGYVDGHKCTYCDGSGDCHWCHGSKKCPHCNGTGKKNY